MLVYELHFIAKWKYWFECHRSVTCLTKGNDRIQDMVAPFLEQQISWIRSRATIVGKLSVSIGTARYYKGKAIGNSELVEQQ
jgi:hypothetical protein